MMRPVSPVGRRVVKDADQLVFQVRALLLDHDHFLQAFGEAPRALGLQRPGHADLVETDAERPAALFGQAEIFERLARVEIGLAGGHDADARLGARLGGIDHHPVEAVGAHEGLYRRHLRAVQALFRLERRIGIANAEAAWRQLEIRRHHDLDALGIDPHRRATFDGLGDRLEADPAAGVARQRKAQHAEVEIFLDGRGIDDRDHRRRENLLALVRQRGGLAAMVVAGQRDHAAILRGTGGIAVLQHVHRAVHAGALAVPDREHAIDGGAGKEIRLLAAPHRGRGEILVEPGLEVDVVLFQVPLRAPQRVVVHAERRAAIAGDEAAGVEAGRSVALLLHHRQAHQRLDAGEIHAALVQAIAVFKCVVAEDERNG
jgi:hypothetical protein